MGIYIEALILYILLFFRGTASIFTGVETEAADFTAAEYLVTIITYSVPSLILIWYLAFKTKKIDIWVIRPGRKDLVSFVLSLPGLLITGIIVSVIGLYMDGASSQMPLHLPSSITEWVFLSITCILTAYLEESYFRFYLLSKRDEFNLNPVSALAASVILFSVCHIYEGPWGFMNAVISGTILGFVFLRYYSIHGIAFAHAVYNILIFIINALINGELKIGN
jgi:membrane protease YdiL (CAAX protease family)